MNEEDLPKKIWKIRSELKALAILFYSFDYNQAPELEFYGIGLMLEKIHDELENIEDLLNFQK